MLVVPAPAAVCVPLQPVMVMVAVPAAGLLLPYPAPVKEEAGVDPLLLVQLVPGFDHLVRGR